jgi:hypothetical protein
MTLYTNPDALAKCLERDPNDFYPTPMELVFSATHRLAVDFQVKPTRVLDIGVGDGRWLHAAKTVWSGLPIHGTGVDVRTEDEAQPFTFQNGTDEFVHDDYREWTPEKNFSMVLGNIPYRHAEALLRKAFAELDTDGVIGQLLLLNFLGSQRRMKGFFKEFPLHTVYVLGKRPSFRNNKQGKKGTDAREYAFFVWQKGYTGKRHLDWLDW